MKNTLRTLAVLLLLLTPGALAVSIVHATDGGAVVKALGRLGYKATLGDNGSGVPQIRIDVGKDDSVYLYFFDDDKHRAGYEGLQLYYSVSFDNDVDLDSVNYFNLQHRYAKAYLEDEKTAALESDLDLSPGIVLDSALKSFLKRFLDNLNAFELEVGGQ